MADETSHHSQEEVLTPSRGSSCILWNSKKVSQYCSQGIICSAIGTLPQTPQQSIVLGAPFSVPCQATFREKEKENQETLHDKTDKVSEKQELLTLLAPASPRSASYNALRSNGLIPVDGLKLGVDWLAYRSKSEQSADLKKGSVC